MSNITLSKSFLNADLSYLAKLADASETINFINSDIFTEVSFEEEPKISGRTATFKNPHYAGAFGYYTLPGSASITFSSEDSWAASYKFSNPLSETRTGKIKTYGSVYGSSSMNINGEKGAANYKFTKLIYTDNTGFSWTITGNFSGTHKFNYRSEDGSESYSYNVLFNSFKTTDSNGNSREFFGKIKYNSDEDEYSGFITSMSLVIGESEIHLKGLKMTYDDLLSIETSTIIDSLPSLFSGNDIITISDFDPIADYTVYGYSGDDRITGSTKDDYIDGGYSTLSINGLEHFPNSGNDTLIGGEGDDILIGGDGKNTLTGGPGKDTFIFYKSDFLNEDVNGNLVFNKTSTQVTDFNPKQDQLITSQLGQLEFFDSLRDAQTAKSQFFYIPGKIYLNIEEDSYKPVTIITLTGNPKAWIPEDIFML